MAKTLFDHIKAITNEQNPKYFKTLSDDDKKTWSNYMIHRFLSMNPDWVDTISELQPFTQSLPPEALYLTYIGIIPKGRHFLKYTKGKKVQKYEDWLIDLIVQKFQCIKNQSNEYLERLYVKLFKSPLTYMDKQLRGGMGGRNYKRSKAWPCR